MHGRAHGLLVAWLVWAGCVGALAGAEAIPFPAALDAAAVDEATLADINRHGLVLGNGDLSGLLWEQQGALCIRVTKNDVWDARVDTSQDGPLLKVDVPNNKWSGGSYPPSWKKPYPQPRCAAIIRIGAATGEAGAWQCIRSGGQVNEWLQKDEAGVMAIAGAAGASAGYRWSLDPALGGACTALTFRIVGTPGARYYVNVLARTGNHPVASGWRDTPRAEASVAFPFAAGTPVSAVEFYVMTTDGKRVENRVRDIRLVGGPAPLAVTAGMPDRGPNFARLDLRRAVATAPGASVRSLADRNAFLIQTDREVSLEEIKAAELPAAEQGETDGVKWLHMTLPGDPDYAGMEYALAAASVGTQKVVAVVTSRDTRKNVRDEAMRIARETAAAAAAQLIARHEAEWARYWSASGVVLDDPDFQPWWYRMSYFLRCFAKPGSVPAGLWGVLPNDVPGWHGDYHHNYNAWQPYWTPFILNHPEQAEPWVDYMNAMLPRMQWLAKNTYDCEGACIGISSFAFEPDPAGCKSVNKRQVAIPPYGYTLGMAGMSAQILWYDHLYRPDRARLATTLYPVIREVALFYCSFAEKCPRTADGRAKFGPSYSPEHGGFGVDNVPFDLAYARHALRAAIRAARELGRDAPLAARFEQALALLPDYPTAPDGAGRPIVVDWTGCKFRQIGVHNIIVPVIPVFPGDQVTWFSPEPVKELFLNTIRQTKHRGCNSTVMFGVAKARFSMLDALEDARRYYKPEVQPNGMFHWPSHGFYLSESVGLAAMVSEFLLQSVDDPSTSSGPGTVRVFPCWPKERDAQFANLRAQGGFLVSAEQKGGRVVRVGVTSTVGGRLRLVDPWSGKVVERDTRAGEALAFAP